MKTAKKVVIVVVYAVLLAVGLYNVYTRTGREWDQIMSKSK